MKKILLGLSTLGAICGVVVLASCNRTYVHYRKISQPIVDLKTGHISCPKDYRATAENGFVITYSSSSSSSGGFVFPFGGGGKSSSSHGEHFNNVEHPKIVCESVKVFEMITSSIDDDANYIKTLKQNRNIRILDAFEKDDGKKI